MHSVRLCIYSASLVSLFVLLCNSAPADAPPSEPVVARVEMRLAVGEEIKDVIDKGDLLTVIEEREDDYVIVTHDGVRGAVDKVNAVRIAESGEIYTELIEEFPEEGRYYTLRASSWWALGQPDKALADFDKAIEIGYREPHAYVSRGLFYASDGKYDRAIADYDEALKLDPEASAPLINRAAARMGKGDFEQAISDYSEAMQKVAGNDRQVHSLLRQRAIARKAAGKLDEAIADFSAIIVANPDDFSAVMGRGYVHFRKEDAESAIKDFSRAVELMPEDPVAWNNLGYNQYRLGRHDEALANYNEAVRLAPKYALALQNRAWLLATTEDESLHNPAEAVVSARAACEITGYENVGTLASLAAALAAAGQFDEAVGWQEKVVAMAGESDLEAAKQTLTRYQNEEPFAEFN